MLFECPAVNKRCILHLIYVIVKNVGTKIHIIAQLMENIYNRMHASQTFDCHVLDCAQFSQPKFKFRNWLLNIEIKKEICIMYKVMTPGPTQVRENVRMARSLVCTNPDLDEEFVDFYKETCEEISELLGTKNETLILDGEGILGLEAPVLPYRTGR